MFGNEDFHDCRKCRLKSALELCSLSKKNKIWFLCIFNTDMIYWTEIQKKIQNGLESVSLRIFIRENTFYLFEFNFTNTRIVQDRNASLWGIWIIISEPYHLSQTYLFKYFYTMGLLFSITVVLNLAHFFSIYFFNKTIITENLQQGETLWQTG